MIAGHRPFHGETEAAVMYSILENDLEVSDAFRQQMPAGLDELVVKALEKDPDDRFQNAASMLAALDAVMNDTGSNWCAAVDVFHTQAGMDNLGTPGAANPSCP